MHPPKETENEAAHLAELVIELRRQTSESARYKQLAEATSLQLNALASAQENFIAGSKTSDVFTSLLSYLLEICKSEYGFIGEVLHKDDGQPFLRTHAITNIAWNDATSAFYEKHRVLGLDFHNLKTLFGHVMTDESVMIANDPYNHPLRGGIPEGHPPLNAFLGVP